MIGPATLLNRVTYALKYFYWYGDRIPASTVGSTFIFAILDYLKTGDENSLPSVTDNSNSKKE